MSEQASERFEIVEDQQLGLLRWLPPAWRDYALLARLERPIGTWLLLIPAGGAWRSHRKASISQWPRSSLLVHWPCAALDVPSTI